MPGYAVIERRRVISKEEADAMRGALVPLPDRDTIINTPTLVVDPDLGAPVMAYLPLSPADTAKLTDAVTRIPAFSGVSRAGSLRSLSRTFGMAPRRPVNKHDSCRITALARDHPDIHAVLAELSLTLGDTLASFAPEIAARDRATIDAVGPEWRMAEGSLWTSGVVNHTAQLPYHRDALNFDAWSAMPVVRRGVTGGYLNIPEYGLTPSCRNGYVVYFNGHKLLHGVTPLQAPARQYRSGTAEGYRLSVVYYALRGMKDCYTFAAEHAQGRVRRTEREDYQARVLRGQETKWW